MKKACLYLSFDDYFCGNKIFAFQQEFLGEYNKPLPYRKLKDKFLEYGYDLSTQDINKPEDSEIVIYFSMPYKMPINNHPNSYLLRWESEIISPQEWKKENLKSFKKIFTWHDEIVDNEKFIKFNFPQLMPKEIKRGLDHKEKFCTLIAGNKLVKHPLEIYSKRIEAIRWFEKNHPDKFDLYGRGWESGYIKVMPKITKLFRKFNFINNLFVEKYSSYKGMIDIKKPILEKYKFSICYENARDIPGYITEKIFDCFFAGCVPVYWGANNITDHIPKECFIDKRDFNTYEKLYEFLEKMTNEEYLNYQKNIYNFVYSDKIYQFTPDYFANIVVKSVFEQEGI